MPKAFVLEIENLQARPLIYLLRLISRDLPPSCDWDTTKHHHLLGSDVAYCAMMTKLRALFDKLGMSLFAFFDDRGHEIHQPRVQLNTCVVDKMPSSIDEIRLHCLASTFHSFSSEDPSTAKKATTQT